jgi:tRNA-dihydrouridine synthase B
MNGLKIKDIKLENNIILAPMAGITDLTFRTICKEFGAGLVSTEMVSAKGLYYKDKKTEELMKSNEHDRPLALQIFGNEPAILAFVVENIINDMKNIDIIDINMGCPAPKIVKNGDGAALMKNPRLAGEIVKRVRDVSRKPLTVKFRSGWDVNSINAVDFAKIIEANGADAITVHGRHREQFYSGKADYNIIKMVKDSVKIPVIGNGDVFTVEDAKKLISTTNCDGIMVARGVLGNPWLIKNLVNAIRDNSVKLASHLIIEPTPVQRLDMLKKHIQLLNKELPEKITVLEMRKHAAWYIKGLKNSSEMRCRINTIDNLELLCELLDKFIEGVV